MFGESILNLRISKLFDIVNEIRIYLIWHRILQYSDKKASLNIDGQLSSPPKYAPN
jgi:hypothetical protein